ncbi:MAG: 30S ribosomal protein S20 [Omnitrophica WOR_2 bacterium RBG_13_41_10]|nr:MAG: 30S ribosomal protein S20 [Omnitrophica WOR_2 bacterium RBG_13_41_10]
MPRHRSAVKRQRVDKKKRIKNLKVQQPLKKTIKKFQELLSAKNLEEAKTILKKIYSLLDKAGKKHIIHPNTANRKKSRLTKSLHRATHSKAT